jgi:uncharacterized LabA/DUF88 family protein
VAHPTRSRGQIREHQSAGQRRATIPVFMTDRSRLMAQTIWIVDGAYAMKTAPGRFEYVKLKQQLEQRNGSPFYESYYLNSTPNPPTDQQDAFHTWLKSAPPAGPKFRVQLYKLKDVHNTCPKCGHAFDRPVQKGVDVGIATLLIKLGAKGKFDRVVLLAGDGDFEDAVNYVKSELNKQVWIAGYMNSVSTDLQSYSDQMIWINDFWKEIEKASPAPAVSV